METILNEMLEALGTEDSKFDKFVYRKVYKMLRKRTRYQYITMAEAKLYSIGIVTVLAILCVGFGIGVIVSGLIVL